MRTPEKKSPLVLNLNENDTYLVMFAKLESNLQDVHQGRIR